MKPETESVSSLNIWKFFSGDYVTLFSCEHLSHLQFAIIIIPVVPNQKTSTPDHCQGVESLKRQNFFHSIPKLFQYWEAFKFPSTYSRLPTCAFNEKISGCFITILLELP
ncbi:hypothetical protein GOODEAATRI_015075 [Goodea atripinnis]|uniref:Uncharacterized protein n=1 Tax=Goodea atripinnis TaxID=208336 RepID=A0ABV0N2E8_9TELE